jgi:hypothetical protein
MPRLISITLTALLLAVGLLATPASAKPMYGTLYKAAPSGEVAALFRGCVTRREYFQIGGRRLGAPRSVVTQIFDTRGRIVERVRFRGLRDIWVLYSACNGRSTVQINFDDYSHAGERMRLFHKDWRWN